MTDYKVTITRKAEFISHSEASGEDVARRLSAELASSARAYGLYWDTSIKVTLKPDPDQEGER